MDMPTWACPLAPPGFRFHPTDQELMTHYLLEKVSNSCSSSAVSLIADVDIYKHDPWELPGKAVFGEEEWFFFSPRNRKYPNGARPNRAAASGYWKATGTDKPILSSDGSYCLGVKKALVFYRGRPPKGMKTDWTMHEYRLIDQQQQHQPSHRLRGSMLLDDWVLCQVRRKGSNRRGSSSSLVAGGFSFCDSLQDQNQTLITKDTSSSVIHSPEVSTPDTNLALERALDSIRRILSVGALDELIPVSPKRKVGFALQSFSTSNGTEDS